MHLQNSSPTKGILVLTPFFRPNIGGVETHLDDLCGYLDSHDYKVFVVTYQPLTTRARGLRLEKKHGLEVRRISWPGFDIFHKLEHHPFPEFIYITPRLFIGAFCFLLKNHGKIVVIHAHGFNAAFIARIASAIFKKRFVVSTHAIYGLNRGSLMSYMIRRTLQPAHRILTLSKPSKVELVKIGLDKDKIEVYKHWVDQEVFRPLDKTETKKKLRLRAEFIVLFVGRLIGKKGMAALWAVARQTAKDIHFVFIGDGPLAPEIESWCARADNISFFGRVDNRDLPLYYNAADIFCAPSQYEEGSGRVILEAISCGTPVVASDKGGIPELVSDEVAVLVEPTVENLKMAIEGLYEDRGKLDMLRSNCRAFAEKNFSERNAAIFLESYGLK